MDVPKLLHFSKCVLRSLFVMANNLYCIPTYLVWMWFFFWPLRLLKPSIYWFIEGVLFKWLLCMVSSWSYGANYRILEVGEDISSCYNQRCLILVNHQSTADVPLLMAAFQSKEKVTNRIVWIMDRLFRYTNFGAVSMTHGDFFITQGKDVRETQLNKLKTFLLNCYLERHRQWLVLFPEGGFLRKRKEVSQQYAKKFGYPVLEYVSLPRVGAMHTIVNTLKVSSLQRIAAAKYSEFLQPLNWVIDVTIGYPNGDPLDLPTICSAWREPCVTYLHYRRYSVEEIPYRDLDALTNWVYERWAEKEEMLTEFYRTGRFPDTPASALNKVGGHKQTLCEPEKVTFSYWWIAFLHVFFILSTLFHIFVFLRLWLVLHSYF